MKACVNTFFKNLQIMVLNFEDKNELEKSSCYNSRLVKMLTMLKTVHFLLIQSGLILDTPAFLSIIYLSKKMC